jgi:hypothetical protein
LVDELRLSGHLTLRCDSLRASQVFISNASILAFTHGDSLFELTPVLAGTVLLAILYATESTEPQESWLAGFSFLSIGNLSLPEEDEGWRFCISAGVCSEAEFRDIHGLFTLVPGEGQYTIIADGGVRGFLGPADADAVFRVSGSGSFFSHAYLNVIARTLPLTATPTSYFTIWSINPAWNFRSVFVATGLFLFLGFDPSSH